MAKWAGLQFPHLPLKKERYLRFGEEKLGVLGDALQPPCTVQIHACTRVRALPLPGCGAKAKEEEPAAWRRERPARGEMMEQRLQRPRRQRQRQQLGHTHTSMPAAGTRLGWSP